ncbi:MAG TPA: LytR C-terminal domain-containing protein [Gaiellaceae bacterium]|nr:LytR C-terminal domain-containing protein [Gaiellaceae bacterium]
MDAPISPQELIRPWRTATLIASLVAALELVLLLGAAALLIAKPLAHSLQHHAETVAYAPAKKKAITPPVPKKIPVGKAKLSRAQTGVLVLNGNGQNGAASRAAAKLHSLGYPVLGTGNAQRQDYATTVVLYRKGFQAEAARLARDLKVTVTGPLDGLSTSALHGGKLAVILGA